MGFITGEAQMMPDSAHWSIQLEDVVVTAQYAPTDLRSAIHPVRTLDKSVISRRFAPSLDKALAFDAGIRIRQDMLLGSAISLMGQDGQSIKILMDGVPIIGRMNGNIDLGQIPLHQIERIEIVEGPLSVQYGTDALGGVINIITRPAPLRKIETSLRTSYESLGESRADVSASAWFTHSLMARIEGGYFRFDGFAVDTTRDMLWNPKTQWYLGGALQYQLNNRQRLQYRYQYMDEVIDNLGIIRRPQFKPYAFDDYYYTTRSDHTLRWQGAWKDSRILSEVMVAANHWDRIKESRRTDIEQDSFILMPEQQDTNGLQAYHLRATVGTQLSGSWNGMLGTEIRRDIAEGSRITDPLSDDPGKSTIDDYAFFGSVKKHMTKGMFIEGGLRWSHNTRFSAPVVPSLHIKYDINNEWTTRASYARGFRAPNAKELYFVFLDVNHHILGNPDLIPEDSDNFQVALQWDKKNPYWTAHVRVTGFYNDVRNRIDLYEYYEKDGVKVPAQGDTVTLQFAYFNYDRLRQHGGQLQVKGGWKNFQLQSGVLVNGYHEPLHASETIVPRVTYVREYSWDASYRVPRMGTTFSLMGRYYDRLLSFYPEKVGDQTVMRYREQKGFSLMDFQVFQPLWKEKIKIHAGIRNLLNVQRTGVLDTGASLQHNSGTGNLPISPGRTWVIGLEWRG